MSNNLAVFLRLNWDGGRVAAGLGQAEAQLRKFSSGASKQFLGLRKHAHELSTAMGGFSNISRLAGGYLGLQGARAAITSNLNFEKTLLEAKQLAEMNAGQAARMRDMAINLSRSGLASPQENAEAIQTLANAGMRFEAIEGTIAEANRSAVAFRSTVKDIANMDFDLQEKFKITPEQLKAVHNMLYYHSKAGRFEAQSLSMFAPKFLTKLAQVGIGGVQGVNLTGAILQAVQKAAPATDPSTTVTMLEHGMGHLFNAHDKKNMRKFAKIDVQKYTPGGKFYGEGGVQGMLDMAQAMKGAGLMDMHKLGRIFREQYTQTFWYQIMQNLDEVREAMRKGDQAMNADTIEKDYKEVMGSNFGKVKRAQNTVDRAELGGAATAGTSAWARIVEYASENPLQAGMGGLGLLMAGRMGYNRMVKGKGGGAGGIADAAMGMAGVQRVFVVNMPGAAGVGGGQLALPPGAGWSPEGAAKASRWAGSLGAAKGALKLGVPLALLSAGFDAYNVHNNDQLNAQAKKLEYGRIAGGAAGGLGGAAIGAGIGALFGGVGAIPGALIGAWLGQMAGEKAGRAATEKIILNNTIILDGRVVAESVQEHMRDAANRD
ncbi:MAG: hypothetical protein CVU73_12870 [Deltaproteobacteria bacterium HGW-Deltaproteobacteria-8]|nr:MAG: hypothetical protein CVU73_12870 [Deltaproteobacteria bacterium HGW-Deltaproteobacteria-8]